MALDWKNGFRTNLIFACLLKRNDAIPPVMTLNLLRLSGKSKKSSHLSWVYCPTISWILRFSLVLPLTVANLALIFPIAPWSIRLSVACLWSVPIYFHQPDFSPPWKCHSLFKFSSMFFGVKFSDASDSFPFGQKTVYQIFGKSNGIALSFHSQHFFE